MRRFDPIDYMTNEVREDGEQSNIYNVNYTSGEGYYIPSLSFGNAPWGGYPVANRNFYYSYRGMPDVRGGEHSPTANISFNHETFSEGVHDGNIILTHTFIDPLTSWYSHGGYQHVLQEGTPYWMQANGEIVVTRQASEW